MADKRRKKSQEDIMHGRSLEGASYGATEREQTEAILRNMHPAADEAGEYITDAELDERELEARAEEDRSDE